MMKIYECTKQKINKIGARKEREELRYEKYQGKTRGHK
jgi:hypothetical protein